MYGLEAISVQNGWAMAITGALIVVSGLALLSFVISQLHKVLNFWEKHTQPAAAETDLKPKAADTKTYDPERPLLNMAEAVKHYQAASKELGVQFPLKDLYTIFYHSGFPHPHLTIRSLREEGFLIPVGEDAFSWKT